MKFPRLVTFDVDGVLVDSPFIEVPNRTPEEYLRHPVMDPRVVSVINKIMESGSKVGIITARHIKYQQKEFIDTKQITAQQLASFGVEVDKLEFLIPLIAGEERVRLLSWLKPVIHFDDDLTVATSEYCYEVYRDWTPKEKWDNIITALEMTNFL